MKLRIFTVVVCIQIIGIAILFIYIQKKRNDTLGVSINPISSKTIQQVSVGELKYFFEPKANTVEESHREWLTYVPKYTINNDSLNERFNYDAKKKQEVFRIITLGDSFTFGENVNTKDNWTELLEDMLNKNNICTNINKIEVINLGVQGYDITYEIARYKLRGIKYNPDLIIWFLIDPTRMSDLINKIKERDESKLREKGVNMQSYEPWFYANEEVMNIYSKRTIYDYQLKMLKKIDSLYVGPIIFMIQEYGSGQNLFPYVNEYIGKRTNKLIHQTIPVSTMKEYHFNEVDQHPNKDGHLAIAEDMYQYISKSNIIPCSQQTNQ